MLQLFLSCFLFSTVGCGFIGFLLQRSWARRVRILEQDLQELLEAMCQMAEVHSKDYRKLAKDVGDIEEKVLDLAVPFRDSTIPLEQRHQVIALARRGVTPDEIAKRLNIPRGEAELILSLRKYAESAAPRLSKATAELKHYAETQLPS